MTTPRLRSVRRWVPVLALVLTSGSAPAATITIVNLDPPGQGFNDPTPTAPVGGNMGTTVGQQRLIVFQTAAAIWGGILPSDVPIRVDASWAPLPCSALSGVLGGAGPNYIFWDFPHAPFGGTSYTKAQANKHAGYDLYPPASDIGAQFNSEVGTPGCLEVYSWYYGLDQNEGSNQLDVLPLILHEMGHGLGFLTFVNDETGELAYGVPDIYSKFVLDQKTGLHWDQETNAQRVASDTSTFRVFWDGPETRTQALATLGPRPLLRLNTPPAIASDLAVGTATFGAALSSVGVTGDVVLADDGSAPTSDACGPLVNAAQIAGKIALVDRGTCTFADKVKTCQNAGAIGVIVVNNIVTTEPRGMSGVDPSITIPSLFVTKADGDGIKAYLAGGVSATLRVDPTRLAGADAQGRVNLYAPDPTEPGSSISHWDVTCTPNLLMEPFLNADLTSSVDLTRDAFSDMGWFLPTTGIAAELRPLAALDLAPNSPNPFARSTVVAFEMPSEGDADLAVFDVSGRLVKRLVHGPLPAGSHRAVWDATDEVGQSVQSGAYFYRLRVGGETRARTMLFVR